DKNQKVCRAGHSQMWCLCSNCRNISVDEPYETEMNCTKCKAKKTVNRFFPGAQFYCDLLTKQWENEEPYSDSFETCPIQWQCICGKLNPEQDDFCSTSDCNLRRPWRCKKCGNRNIAQLTKCLNCFVPIQTMEQKEKEKKQKQTETKASSLGDGK